MSQNTFNNDWHCAECETLQSKHNQWFDGLCETCYEANEIDLFEQYETLPQEVQDVINKFIHGDYTYEICNELIIELNQVGYTCEFGLDAEPYGLKKL